MVQAEGLTKRYRKAVAVEGLTFGVGPGEVYALLGPNGAGKTTTLRLLSTLVRPSAGRALVAGFDVVREPLEVRRNLGLVNGGMRVYERLTGREVLEFFASLDLLVLEVYGQSEDCGPTSFNRLGKAKLGTVGPAIDGVEVKIAPDGGASVK